MTIAESFLRRLVAGFESAGIPYMVVGSYGSSLLGRMRPTYDIDIVIDPTAEQLELFLPEMADFYVDSETARSTLRDRSMFNVIDFQTGSKADLIILNERPFSVSEFERRKQAAILGVSVWLISSEDVIVSKLEWSKMGESERQFQDALGVAIMQGDNLDWAYMHKWAVELDVETLLDRLIAEVDTAKKARPS